MADIGKNIAERRKELGLTQEELASRMGYKSKSTINKIELGKNDIPQSRIVKFAEVLDTTPARLMGWEKTQKNSGTENDAADTMSESKKLLIDFAKTVPEEKAELVLRVMKSILEGDK